MRLFTFSTQLLDFNVVFLDFSALQLFLDIKLLHYLPSVRAKELHKYLLDRLVSNWFP